MENAMKSLEKKFGYVEFEGKKYILIQDAYLDDICIGDVCIDGQVSRTVYTADAIKDGGDRPDDDGYVPLYRVEWSIINPEMEDEGDRCDWDNPSNVMITNSMYNIEEDSVY